MNSLTQWMPVASTISHGTLLKRRFVIGYLNAIAIATIGWVSAFGWLTISSEVVVRFDI
jgi:hypothetical protein